MDDPNILLPKAPILGYISNISTPTRVRVIAARCVFWIGVVLFLVSMVLFCWIVWRFWGLCSSMRFFRGGRGGPAPVDILTRIKAGLTYDFEYAVYFFLTLVFIFTPALIFVSFTASIRRGRRASSVIAMILLTPLALSIMFATALLFGAIYVQIFGDHGRHDFDNAPWLLVTPVPVLIVLLLKDLCAFLFWIARQPTIEMPPQPFLPTRNLPG